MNRIALSRGIAALLLYCAAATAGATTRTVTNLNDSGAGSLRDTLAASQGGDTINFSVTGEIQLTSGPLAVNKSVTIAGPGPALLQVVRASGSFRVFTIEGNNSTPTVAISGITIAYGFAVDVGHGPEGFGGGIYSYRSYLTVTNCVVTGNISQYWGGGISVYTGTLTVIDTTFSHNGTMESFPVYSHIGGGGAIYDDNARVSLINCTFVDNSTTATGTDANGGGAIYNSSGSVVMTNCTFSNNRTNGSMAFGGGIYNTTPFGGRADLTVHNCTFSENASSNGGGIANQGASGGNAFVNLDNTILFSSSNTPGANLLNTGDGAAITSKGYNLSSDDGGGFLTNTGDQKNTNPNLGPLQDNGGPTQTMALLPGSPAQDKGFALGTRSDQRGLPRPLNIASIPNAPQGDGSDIGAVEMDGVQTAPDFTVSTTDDHDDGTCGYADCTLREAIKAANAAGGANTIHFTNTLYGAIGLNPQLGTLTVTSSVAILYYDTRRLAISGNHAVRVFSFSSGQSSIYGLTIEDGAVAPANGSGTGAAGAGILNGVNSSLTLYGCLVSGNSLYAGWNDNANGTGGSGSGGGIANFGTLFIDFCTFSNNSALGGRGSNATGNVGNIDGGTGGAAQGGGVFNGVGASLTMDDSTIGNNSAIAGNGGNGRFGATGGLAAGGVFNLGTMTLTAVTVSGNTGTGGLGGAGNNFFNNGTSGVGIGGLAARGSKSTVGGTISAGNMGHDADGAFTSQGYNLIGVGDFSTGFAAQGDKVGTTANRIDPKLGPLQNNGGATDTFALAAGSPAIDAGQSMFVTVSLSSDQRFGQRTIDDPQVPNAAGSDGTDIGAYEAGALPPALPTVITGAASNVTTTSATLNVTINPHGYATTFNFTSDFAVFPTQQAGSGITDAPFSVNVAGLAPNTTYHFNVSATSAGGTTVADEQAFTTASIPPTTLANVATRLKIETGDNVLFGGFIITGTQPKKVIVRALGPSVQAPGVLADPTLELYQGNTLLEANDNWVDSPNKQAISDSTIAPPNNLESAIVRTLPANGTGYTAIVRGANNGTGIGVIEVYDLDGSVDSKLANISTRGLVQTGDNVLIAGTIVVGQAAQKVLICALGPSLPLQGNLSDPTLELHDGSGTLLEANDNWVDSPNKQAIIDTGIAPSNNVEAAIIHTLPANGALYTAIVRGVNNATGIAVVEVYALQ